MKPWLCAVATLPPFGHLSPLRNDEGMVVFEAFYAESGEGIVRNRLNLSNKKKANHSCYKKWLAFLSNWWRRRGSNPRPKSLHPIKAIDTTLFCCIFIWLRFGGVTFYEWVVMFAAILPPLLTAGEVMLKAKTKAVLTVVEYEGLQERRLEA
ncbi:hypothetical protein [Shewanella sp. YLB-07]|uniref:hypothetical protein n=1 Tax=Shewanella sp. YLB-07 TaxID=2601268 RepID=UPI00128E6EDF|nr:hypothetical protein [Shewanella sp. YLB-07]MPY25010.1 hypothetical protein [Shewanella sp. YLB-07]